MGDVLTGKLDSIDVDDVLNSKLCSYNWNKFYAHFPSLFSFSQQQILHHWSFILCKHIDVAPRLTGNVSFEQIQLTRKLWDNHTLWWRNKLDFCESEFITPLISAVKCEMFPPNPIKKEMFNCNKVFFRQRKNASNVRSPQKKKKKKRSCSWIQKGRSLIIALDDETETHLFATKYVQGINRTKSAVRLRVTTCEFLRERVKCIRCFSVLPFITEISAEKRTQNKPFILTLDSPLLLAHFAESFCLDFLFTDISSNLLSSFRWIRALWSGFGFLLGTPEPLYKTPSRLIIRLALALASAPQPWTSGMWCAKQNLLPQNSQLCPKVAVNVLHFVKLHVVFSLTAAAIKASKSSSFLSTATLPFRLFLDDFAVFGLTSIFSLESFRFALWHLIRCRTKFSEGTNWLHWSHVFIDAPEDDSLQVSVLSSVGSSSVSAAQLSSGAGFLTMMCLSFPSPSLTWRRPNFSAIWKRKTKIA